MRDNVETHSEFALQLTYLNYSNGPFLAFSLSNGGQFMTKLLIYSLLALFAQATFADEQNHGQHTANSWDANKTIGSWGSNKSSEESFESSLSAIKRELQDIQELDPKKLEFLSDWIKKLSNAQITLKKRAQEWLDDPTLTDKSKHALINRIVLYGERIKTLDELTEKIESQELNR